MVALVGEEVRASGHEERPKSAFLGGDGAKIVLFEQSEKEFLDQVLGGIAIVTFASHERIQRIPVRLAQGRQGLAGFGRRTVDGGEDEAPLGGRERGRGDESTGS